jgi:drug/metabolite transporter (DMT)-like permease
MDVFFGASTALTWGIAVFASRWSVRAVGSVRTTYYSHAIALVLLTAFVLSTGALVDGVSRAQPMTWLWLVIATTANTGGSLLLYRAVQHGPVSIVVSIGACYAVVIVVLSFLSGETLRSIQALGIVLAMAGVLLTTFTASRDKTTGSASKLIPTGIALAIASAFSYGLAWWLFGLKVTPELGGALPTWATRVNSVVLLSAVALFSRDRLQLPLPRGSHAWGALAIVGVLEASGVLLNLIGYRYGSVSVVSTLASLYSSVTVVLAFVILRERLLARQWAGVAAIALSVAVISAG